MGRSLRFWLTLLALVPLLVVVGRADIHDSAPADEYFGPFKESILGIRNHIVDLERKADSELADAAKGMDNIELALEDWHRHYPRDGWLPGFLDRMVHVYGRAHLLKSARCQTAFAMLEHDFKNTPQARDAASFVSTRK